MSEDREAKNAVFTQQSVQQGPQFISQQEAARQQGIQIPTEIVPLPSRGLVYPPEHPLHKKETVDIFGMTTAQEDILLNKALIKKGTVITELIKSCLVNRAIDVNSLISGDRNALMIAIRMSGYGGAYDPQIKCPSCELMQEFHIDLTKQTNVKWLEKEPVSLGQNLFEFKLPKSGKTVLFKFLTGAEEEEIVATAEAKKKKGIFTENAVSTKLFYSIQSIDSDTTKSNIAQYVKWMSAGDSKALRQYMDKVEPTVEVESDFECKSCNHTEKLGLPMTAEFFWPRGSRE